MAIERPNLGYGKPSEATIDQVNTWMRSTPWYQQQMRAWGQDPGHPTLSKSQSQQILRQAQANGVVVDEGDMQVDDHGNFNPKGHKLRNTLIVAGIAGATIATMGAAGAFAGAAGAGAGAGGTAGASAIPALEGGATLAANLGTASALPALGAAGAAGASLAPALDGGASYGGGAAAGGPSVVNKVKNAVTGGRSTSDFLKDLALLGGGNLLGGLGESLFQQKRNSFSGTEADPVAMASGLQRRLNTAGDALSGRAFGGVQRPGPDMPDPSGNLNDLEGIKQSLRLLGAKV